MRSPIGKIALDAMTDQSFAQVRDDRADAHPHILQLSVEAAAMLAEQFPGHQEIAGQVVMCVVHMLGSVQKQLGTEDAQLVEELTDILALAAEQVVREPKPAGEPQ